MGDDLKPTEKRQPVFTCFKNVEPGKELFKNLLVTGLYQLPVLVFPTIGWNLQNVI